MITNLIVGLALLMSGVFVAAWWRLPGFRAWVERPKYRFQDALQGYDRSRRPDAGSDEGHPA